jgi:ribosomal protein L37E
MSYNCPSCQRVLYNRRLKTCGFCGAPIPEEWRFTPEESAALDRRLAELEELKRQRERVAANVGGEAGYDSGFVAGGLF